MSPQAQLVMLLWLPILIYIFMRLPPQKAVVFSFICAWLFLPQQAGFRLPGLPDYTRMSATCYGILLATLIFDFQRFRSFKYGWLDVPMTIFCLCPFASSMTNGLGAYDGLSGTLEQTVAYGLPYFLGRIYLNDLMGLQHLAKAIFIGGLIYAPLCLFEIRFSPQLHKIIYGYHGIRQFSQGIRLGGYRPTVFMQHGLSVGMWMMAATLIGIWLWQAGLLKTVWNIPIGIVLFILTVTFVLVKSTGAYLYLAYGLFTLVFAKTFRTSLTIWVLIIAICSYLYLTTTGSFYVNQMDKIVQLANDVVGPDRAQSLEFRLANEQILSDKARQQPVFGWGGWSRNRVYEEKPSGEIKDIAVTDSLWIITFGVNGAVGLIAVFASCLLISFMFPFLGYPASLWFNPKVAPAAVLSIVIVLYMLDGTLNNQFNPVFILATGGISGLLMNKSELSKLKKVRASPRLISLSPEK